MKYKHLLNLKPIKSGVHRFEWRGGKKDRLYFVLYDREIINLIGSKEARKNATIMSKILDE